MLCYDFYCNYFDYPTVMKEFFTLIENVKTLTPSYSYYFVRNNYELRYISAGDKVQA